MEPQYGVFVIHYRRNSRSHDNCVNLSAHDSRLLATVLHGHGMETNVSAGIKGRDPAISLHVWIVSQRVV
jgi:hypothetical protein